MVEINKRKKYSIIISVDEEILRSQRDTDESFSLKEAVENEFGWLYKSGIYLEKFDLPQLKTDQ